MNLREIAQAAGVSLTSVSLVLNGKPGVGDGKRALIRRLLLKNGYSPPAELAGDQTFCFVQYSRHGHLVSGNPGFVTQIMDSVESECRRLGIQLLVTVCRDFRSPELSELLSRPTIHGIILLGTEVESREMADFPVSDKALVVVDNALPRLPYDTVTMDNQAAIFSAVEHLWQLGHREIGFLYNALPSNNDRERLWTFRGALQHFGLPFRPDQVYPLSPTMEGAMESTLSLLDTGRRFPRALVGNNDSIAIGAMRAFQSRGISIPRELSLTGLDGLPFSALSKPSLTTIKVPCGEIGVRAVWMLSEQLRSRRRTPCQLRVRTSFLPGGSTAPPWTGTLPPALS